MVSEWMIFMVMSNVCDDVKCSIFESGSFPPNAFKHIDDEGAHSPAAHFTFVTPSLLLTVEASQYNTPCRKPNQFKYSESKSPLD